MTDRSKSYHTLDAQTGPGHQSVMSVNECQRTGISGCSPENVNKFKGISASQSQSVKSVQSVTEDRESNLYISSALAVLEYRQPDLVSVADWQRAVDDGRRFIVQWGEQAEALRWTADDLFGLHDPPEQPGPSYRRLSRYDVMGMIWLLHGRPVVALTADRAVIGRVGGPTFCRERPEIKQMIGASRGSHHDD